MADSNEPLTTGPNLPLNQSCAKFISQFSYNPPDGRHLALVDGHTIYTFDHHTTHLITFQYSHRKFYTDYSEYYFKGSDGREYIVFTLMAAKVLIPGLTIPDPPVVISPVQSTITLIHPHGTIEVYPVSHRVTVARLH